MRYAICFCLYLGFTCLFTYFCLGNRLEQFYRKTKNTLKKSNRETILMMRRALLQSQDKNPFWFQVEKCVYYTGLKRRFPFLSGMHLVLGGIVATALLLLLLMPFGFVAALLGCSVFGVATFGVLFFLRKREWKQTGQSLMSFLDFLGNYSVTAGEIRGFWLCSGLFRVFPSILSASFTEQWDLSTNIICCFPFWDIHR